FLILAHKASIKYKGGLNRFCASAITGWQTTHFIQQCNIMSLRKSCKWLNIIEKPANYCLIHSSSHLKRFPNCQQLLKSMKIPNKSNCCETAAWFVCHSASKFTMGTGE